MSRTRHDRNRAARQQRWESDYAHLTGGLDQSSSALQISNGRMSYCVNWEEVFGQRGYTTTRGYERFDGMNARPSKATYRVIPFEGGNASGPSVIGSAITNGDGSVTATWVSTEVTAGALADGTAEGFVVVYDLAGGEFAASEPVKFAGNAFASATDATAPASRGYSFHRTAMTALREYLRALVTIVPGSGPVRGGAIFDDVAWVVRDNAAGTGATLWRTDEALGWTAVRKGLTPGVRYRFKQANFTGDPANIHLYMVNGRDRLLKISAVSSGGTSAKAAPIYGSEATSTTSLTIGLGAKILTCVETSRGFVAGDLVTIWYDDPTAAYDGRDRWMQGAVTAYNSGTGQLDVNVTAISGAGTFTAWEVGRTDFRDKPFLLQPHKNHMFLGYPRGQVQTSNLGDGMVYTSTATVFGMGQELTGFSSLKGEALAVMCDRKVEIIRGSSQLDWDQGTYSEESGAVMDTIQDNDGNPIFLDAKGLTTLQATQNFGDFAAGVFGRDFKKFLDSKRAIIVGARIASNNNQYRLYFSDGYALRVTLMGGGQQAISARNVSGSISQYPDIPSCFLQGFIDGEERMFFGCENGYLIEEDCGTSHDGAVISSAFKTPYGHAKTPGIDKQYHKMELELTGDSSRTIYYRQAFDYDDGIFGTGGGQIDFPGVGSVFDVGTFDVMSFDLSDTYRAEADLDGQGRNMSLLIWSESDFDEPLTLQGLLVYFTKLGVRP